MVTNKIKKLIPAGIKARIKCGTYCNRLSICMNELELDNSSITLIIGTPLHTNLGDHLITLAQEQFLAGNGHQNKVVEIPTEMYQIYRKRLCKLSCVDTIIINGGGWMGNLWVAEELLLQQIIDTFSSKKIIVFPQTIYFDKNIMPYDTLISSANEVFKKCEDITLCVRETYSFKFAKSNYKNVKILLVPDIAFAYYDYAPKNHGEKNKRIGICLREDREALGDSESKAAVINAFKSKGYTIDIISTMYEKRVNINERKEIVDKKLKDFSNYDFIITDRLHGMIFSYITGTPCVVFDNKTHKVSGVYLTWLKKSKRIFPVFSKLDMDLLKEFISYSNIEEENVCSNKDFAELKEIIDNG